jgi:SNF2 family DNA or RNA helicase
LREASGPAALVLNYESAWRDVDELMKLGFDLLGCDESHRLKDRTTATFKGIAKLARRVPTLLLVTGTPILNRAEELWSALHLLWPQRYPSFHSWMKQHFDWELTDFHGKIPRPTVVVHDLLPGHAEILRAEIGDALLYRTEEEIGLQLPPLVEQTIHVKLTAPERKAYDEMTHRAWTRIEGELLQAPNEVAKITRQRQLVGDWGQLTGEETTPGAKVTAAVALAKSLREQGEHVLIVAGHHSTVERIADQLDTGYVHGGVKDGERNHVLGRFKDGSLDILAATLGVVGEGVDGLQNHCHHLILVDRAWNPGGNDQVIGRLRRSGQNATTVYVHHIFADGTVDTKVLGVVGSKSQVINAVTGRA